MSVFTPPLSDVERAVAEASHRRHQLFQQGPSAGEDGGPRDAAVLLVELLDRSLEAVTVKWGRHTGDGSRKYWFEVSDTETGPAYLVEQEPRDTDDDSVWVVSDRPPTDVTDERTCHGPSVLAARCADDELVLWTAILRTRRWGEELFVDERSDSLVNNCFDLAGKLLDHLGPVWGGPETAVDNRTECYVMRGGLRTDRFDPEGVTTIRDADRSGQIHFWVETVDADTGVTYICDPWGRVPTAFGEPFLLTEYPDNYVPTVDGAITYPEMDGDRHWADPLE